jgi:hypothetical protein
MFHVALFEGGLTVGGVGPEKFNIDAAHVSMTLLEGDHGFADANSLTYLFVVRTRAGERVTFQKSWQGIKDFEQLEALRRGLEVLGIYEDGGEIPGAIVPGCVFVILIAFTLVWFAIAAVLAVALR